MYENSEQQNDDNITKLITGKQRTSLHSYLNAIDEALPKNAKTRIYSEKKQFFEYCKVKQNLQ